MTLSITTLCQYPECYVLLIVMLSVVMLSVVLLSGALLSVIWAECRGASICVSKVY
jgi:hypothetical protein